MVDQVTATRLRSLYNFLPKRGFVYIERNKIIQHDPDAVAFIDALALSVPSFGPKNVDRRLAELFRKAHEYASSGERVREGEAFRFRFQPAFEYAARSRPWSAGLDPSATAEAMGYLCAARATYVRFTTYRTPPAHELRVPEGRLARAVDAYTGQRPAAEPLPCFARMEPRLVDMMMERMRRGLRADWDKCSDYNDEPDERPGERGREAGAAPEKQKQKQKQKLR